jgi:hypothetical protein
MGSSLCDVCVPLNTPISQQLLYRGRVNFRIEGEVSAKPSKGGELSSMPRLSYSLIGSLGNSRTVRVDFRVPKRIQFAVKGARNLHRELVVVRALQILVDDSEMF